MGLAQIHADFQSVAKPGLERAFPVLAATAEHHSKTAENRASSWLLKLSG